MPSVITLEGHRGFSYGPGGCVARKPISGPIVDFLWNHKLVFTGLVIAMSVATSALVTSYMKKTARRR